MREDKDRAHLDGYALGLADAEYRRNWENPYVTGAGRWAMVRGYEAAWDRKRSDAAAARHCAR